MSEIIKITDPDTVARINGIEQKPLIESGPPPISKVEKMAKSVFCDHCKKLVSRVIVDYHLADNKIVISAECHGEDESCGLSRVEFEALLHYGGKAIVFRKKLAPTTEEENGQPNHHRLSNIA